MEKEIEKAIKETLVIGNPESIKYAVKKILALFSVSNCGGAIPYDSLSDSFKKSIGIIEDNLNK